MMFTVWVLDFSVKFVGHFCHNNEIILNIYYYFLFNLKHDAVVRSLLYFVKGISRFHMKDKDVQQ